jgi:hypothetical protein
MVACGVHVYSFSGRSQLPGSVLCICERHEAQELDSGMGFKGTCTQLCDQQFRRYASQSFCPKCQLANVCIRGSGAGEGGMQLQHNDVRMWHAYNTIACLKETLTAPYQSLKAVCTNAARTSPHISDGSCVVTPRLWQP